MHSTTDVLVLGAGPAGLAASCALRRRGIDCVVVDALMPPIDKACGEGLMPGALAALERLGVDLLQEGAPFAGIRFCDPHHAVEARFPLGPGLGVRRTRLHARMAEHALAAGARILWNTRCTLLGPNHALIDGYEIRFRYLIGADGQSSSVRKWAGLAEYRSEQLRYAFRRHYRIEPWSELVEVHWADCGQVYVTPVSANTVGIAFVSRDKHYDPQRLPIDFPAVGRRMEGAPVVSQQRGALSATRRLREVARGSVALIGDASGSVDAVTGDGLAMCFEQAEALAAAIAQDSMERYVAAHRAIVRRPYQMSVILLLMDRFPALRERAMQALASNPERFRQLLAVHVGAESLIRFALTEGPWLGWELLSQRA